MRGLALAQTFVVAIIMFGAGSFLAGTDEAEAQVRLGDLTCYPISGQTPRFTVRLTDQFADQQVRVGMPSLLCTPVKKAVIQGTPFDVGGDHLKCYTIQGELRQGRRLDLGSQFGRELGVSIRRGATLLCISAAKRVRQ